MAPRRTTIRVSFTARGRPFRTISLRAEAKGRGNRTIETGVMMKTFITRRVEGQGKTKKERKATKSKGRGLEEGASRALMRQHGEGGCGERG